MEKGYTIGDVSKEIGISVKTIRTWEKAELIPIPARTTANYRLYSENDIKVIKTFIERRYKSNKTNINGGVFNG